MDTQVLVTGSAYVLSVSEQVRTQVLVKLSAYIFLSEEHSSTHTFVTFYPKVKGFVGQVQTHFMVELSAYVPSGHPAWHNLVELSA